MRVKLVLRVPAGEARGHPAPRGVRVYVEGAEAVAEIEAESPAEALALADAWLAALGPGPGAA